MKKAYTQDIDGGIGEVISGRTWTEIYVKMCRMLRGEGPRAIGAYHEPTTGYPPPPDILASLYEGESYIRYPSGRVRRM